MRFISAIVAIYPARREAFVVPREDRNRRKRDSAASFDRASEAYRTSDVHRAGEDLDLLATWCGDASQALDVACGAGHAGGAVTDQGVSVVACDAAPRMVRETVEAYPVRGVVADAERLPFADGSFDALTCRIAAHHFPDPAAFVREAARVLEPGGVVAFEDNVAPAGIEAFLNRVERLRDPTHVRSHTEAQWREWFDESGLAVSTVRHTTRRLDFEDWVERLDVDTETRATLTEVFRAAPESVREALDVDVEAGRVQSFDSPKLLLRAEKPA